MHETHVQSSLFCVIYRFNFSTNYPPFCWELSETPLKTPTYRATAVLQTHDPELGKGKLKKTNHNHNKTLLGKTTCEEGTISHFPIDICYLDAYREIKRHCEDTE